MRKVFLFLILFFSLPFGKSWSGACAQNLAPNPSFEDTIGCPDNYSGLNGDEVVHAKGWSSFYATPDYFNSCDITKIVSVPKNIFGYQNAANGNAYCGVATYDKSNPYWREIIGVKLNFPLTVGKKYHGGVKVSLADSSNYATNKIGIAFSTYKIPDFYIPSSINNQAKIYTASIIEDTADWVAISGSFVADSPYIYLMVGNFSNDDLTDTISYSRKSQFLSEGAYYYVDDIYISTDSLYNGNDGIKIVDSNGLFNIHPNPANDKIYFSTNFSGYYSYSLINLLGEEIKNGHSSGASALDVTDVPNGIYILRISYQNKMIQRKQVVVH